MLEYFGKTFLRAAISCLIPYFVLYIWDVKRTRIDANEKSDFFQNLCNFPLKAYSGFFLFFGYQINRGLYFGLFFTLLLGIERYFDDVFGLGLMFVVSLVSNFSDFTSQLNCLGDNNVHITSHLSN